MKHEKFYIPKTLDDPEMIYFWTVGELSIILGCFFIGILMQHAGTGLLLGVGLRYGYRKSKGRVGDILLAYIYWSFPKWLSNFKSLPESYRRRYVG
jgi:type IV conjugative transfer system protein TraL